MYIIKEQRWIPFEDFYHVEFKGNFEDRYWDSGF
jgi:hypothetical protein